MITRWPILCFFLCTDIRKLIWLNYSDLFSIYKGEKRMKMKRHVLILGIVTAIFCSTCSVAIAEDAVKPTANFDLGIFSQYIWRGLEQSYNSAVIEPSLTLGYQGFSFNVWGNLDTDRKLRNLETHSSKYTETDMTLSYAKNLGLFTLGGGYIYYALDGAQDSQELFASTTLNTLLSPTLSIYREVAHNPSWYANLGVSHSIPVIDKITFDLGASAGYYYSDNSAFAEAKNPETKYRAFHNGLVSGGFTIPVCEYLSVKPMIAYSFPLSGKADDYITANSISNHSSFVYGGVTLSAAF